MIPTARRTGLQVDDVIIKVNGQQVIRPDKDIDYYFGGGWPRGRNVLELTVERHSGHSHDWPVRGLDDSAAPDANL